MSFDVNALVSAVADDDNDDDVELEHGYEFGDSVLKDLNLDLNILNFAFKYSVLNASVTVESVSVSLNLKLFVISGTFDFKL